MNRLLFIIDSVRIFSVANNAVLRLFEGCKLFDQTAYTKWAVSLVIGDGYFNFPEAWVCIS